MALQRALYMLIPTGSWRRPQYLAQKDGRVFPAVFDHSSCRLSEEVPTCCESFAAFNEIFTHIRTESDLVFVQDATAGRGSYMLTATTKIEEIFTTISKSTKIHDSDDLRLGVISYQQHQDRKTSGFDFTSSVTEIRNNLDSLVSPIDGPIVSDALRRALDMPWRNEAHKMIVIIVDGLPDGIEEPIGFPWGSPDGDLWLIRMIGLFIYSSPFTRIRLGGYTELGGASK